MVDEPARDTATVDPADIVASRLPVTDRRSWLILLGVVVLIAGALVWAVLGSAPETARGRGMIVPQHGFVDVGRDVDGSVAELRVAPGDHVAAGDVVARLKRGSLSIDVTAPTSGRVATILERAGGYSDPGQPIMTIDPDSGAETAVAFIPAVTGSTVRPGMPAQVGVASYPQSQFGTITGTVRSVAGLPATADRVELLVGGNPSLVDYFMAGGPVLEVTVDLDTDASTPSGYAWTVGTGPDEKLSTGTLVDVTVTIADRSPISRILR